MVVIAISLVALVTILAFKTDENVKLYDESPEDIPSPVRINLEDSSSSPASRLGLEGMASVSLDSELGVEGGA